MNQVLHEQVMKDLWQFLEEKRPGREDCPKCGVSDWSFMIEGAAVGMLPLGPHDHLNPFTTTRHLRMFPYFCQNCGHVEFVAADVFDRWRKETKGG